MGRLEIINSELLVHKGNEKSFHQDAVNTILPLPLRHAACSSWHKQVKSLPPLNPQLAIFPAFLERCGIQENTVCPRKLWSKWPPKQIEQILSHNLINQTRLVPPDTAREYIYSTLHDQISLLQKRKVRKDSYWPRQMQGGLLIGLVPAKKLHFSPHAIFYAILFIFICFKNVHVILQSNIFPGSL